ncbi:MAG: cytidine/deoxycytidylate deaminase family protein [Nanoarchaeota archaeon]
MRPSFDEIFMKMTLLIRERSTCIVRKTGAVLVKNNKVLAVGYNGSPAGTKHCTDHGICKRREAGLDPGEYRDELCRVVHAEENVLLQAAKFGVSTDGATVYCYYFPCTMCSKSMINAGIKEIVFAEDYPNELAKELLQEAGVKVRQFKVDIS